jgi:hypothetical protein
VAPRNGKGKGWKIMIFIGIDPGGSGSMVATRNGKYRVCRFDKATESEVADFLRDLGWEDECFAMLELLRPMPSFGEDGHGMRGNVANFKVGKSCGFLRGLLVAIGIPFEEVSPQKWQRAMGCMSKGDKRVTRAKAQELFPDRKVIHVTADGMLIAEYCRRVISKRG